MNPHDILDIPIFVLLTLICVLVFILQVLYLNHILYDTYTTFVVGLQFNQNKIKNFINIYDKPQFNCIKLGIYWLKLHNSIFKVTRLSKYTISILHNLSRMTFYVTTASKRKKKCIQIQRNQKVSITKDLLYLIFTPGYYIISNRFVD